MGDETRGNHLPSLISSTAMLAGAAIMSLAISFVGALANARFYGPAEVGLFGLFTAIFTLAGLAASWRYELAIVTVDDDGKAADVVLFVVAAGIACGLIAALALLAMEWLPKSLVVSPSLKQVLVGMPPSLLLSSLIAAGTGICIRQQKFGRVAVQQVVASAVTVSAQIALAGTDVPSGGLVVGFILGQIGAVVFLGRPMILALSQPQQQRSILVRIRRVARDHKGHFLYTFPYSLALQLYLQMPLLFLAGLFGPKEVGFYSLAFRTTYTPIGLIPSAAAQAFFPEMAREKDQIGRWESRLLALFTALGMLLAPAAALVLVLGPELYAFALGEQWREAGHFAQIMILPNLMNGLSSGYDRIYFVLQRQRTALILVGSACAVSGLLMFAGSAVGGSSGWLVGGWAIGHLLLTAAWMGTIYWISGFSVCRLLSRSVLIVVAIGIVSTGLVLSGSIQDRTISFSIALVVMSLYGVVALRIVGWPLWLLLRNRKD